MQMLAMSPLQHVRDSCRAHMTRNTVFGRIGHGQVPKVWALQVYEEIALGVANISWPDVSQMKLWGCQAPSNVTKFQGGGNTNGSSRLNIRWPMTGARML
jgi:hypothetical protein